MLDEDAWEVLQRKAPEVYRALQEIRKLYETCFKVFGKRTTYWERKEADLTNKIMCGCLKLEMGELKEKLSGIEEKYRIAKDKEVEWHVFGKEKERVIFENGTGELVKIPLGILDIIVNQKSYDGEILGDGSYVKYVMDGKTVCRIPKSLVNRLSEGGITLGEGRGKI